MTALPYDPSGGMTLRVSHLTRFVYRGGALESHNEVRLRPISDPLQRCLSYTLKVKPTVQPITREDFHQNLVDYVDVMKPHDELEIESIAEVLTRPDLRGPAPIGLKLAALDGPETDVSVFDFQNASPLIEVTVEVAEQAKSIIGDSVSDLWLDAVALAKWVYSSFEYVPGSTDSRTPVSTVMKDRRGVCQDFANATISLCRSRGIPARYVSGYFFNGKTEQHEVEASHAWLEIFVPGYGWKGLDPTHDREADPRYIKLAVGRDYSDVRPVGGRFLGKGSQNMIVEVRVRRLPRSDADSEGA